MQRTKYVAWAAIITLLLWCITFGGYELWVLTNAVPNDTFSHYVDYLWRYHPWLPYVLVPLHVIWIVFWTIVLLHWFLPGFVWKKARWVEADDPRTDIEVKKDDSGISRDRTSL